MIHNECIKRGFKVKDYSSSWDTDACKKYNNDHTPTTEEKYILFERIVERINNSPKPYWHYNHERITKERAIELLYKCK